ncbi:MAG: hypothetical protein ACREFX_04740 [Opitutaceae bacterium]
MNLGDYQTDLQVLLNDTSGQYFQLAQLNTFINWARRRIAGAAECVRWLTPAGTGGLNTVANQEVYTFATANGYIPTGSGMLEILSVRMVAITNGNLRPAWRQLAWSAHESYFRSLTVTGNTPGPGAWSQYGQGASGSIYLFPVPSQPSPMEWDCSMLPIDLATPSDPEAVPDPWTDFVVTGALFRAYIAQQKIQEAAAAEKLFYDGIARGRREAEGSVRIMHPYGGGPE